jgi:hypothetical protein
MTLAPLVIPEIRGIEGKPVALSQWCVVPGCLSLTQQRHHLWPKSYLRGQPYEWVEVAGRVIPNSVGLCVRHHGMVTSPVGGHQAQITYDPATGLFDWSELDWQGEMKNLGSLRGQALVDPEPEVRRVRREEGLCPTCGHVSRERPKTVDGLPKRKAKTWGLLVPDDGEAGTDILDTYVEDLAVVMGLDPGSPRLLRYHVLVPVLEWVNQNKSAFIADWEESGTGPSDTPPFGEAGDLGVTAGAGLGDDVPAPPLSEREEAASV